VSHHVSFARADALRVPHGDDLDRAAALLNAAHRVAILAGQGALGAQAPLRECARKLGAPIVKALLGKAVVPDQDPLTTGGIGLLGTRPSQEVFEKCDALLIVGSTFPYIEYYPKPGQAQIVQIDRDATRIGLRAPADVGLVGDASATLELLGSKLVHHEDRTFLEAAQESMGQWRKLLRESVNENRSPMRPGRIARDLSDRLDANAIIAWDSGHNTGLCARYVEAQQHQLFAGSGTLATMACALPYAIAAAIAFPNRQVVAFVGDGGLAMLLGELATVVRYRLPIKIVVVKNNTLGQIKWEQMMFLGHPEYECDLQPIDFPKVAEAMGIAGYRITDPEQCGTVLDRALRQAGPALIEATVDPDEPLLPPKRIEKYANNLRKALAEGTAGKERIEAALQREPARSMMRD
jgi:pyruvate dehydrogenase (quinone)